jgi:vacuolar-type H+-ATPase subunit F/Vma7
MENNENSNSLREKMREQEYHTMIQKYLDIVDRSQREVDSVRNVYKWLAGCLAIILAAGVATLGITSYNNLRDMKQEMRDNISVETANLKTQADYLKSKTSQDFSLLSNNLRYGLERSVTGFEKKVHDRIDEEFKKENIRLLVQEKAAEYTEKNVHNYIEERVNRTITPIASNLREQNELLTKQVDGWNKRSKLMKLSDEAIENCNAQSFKELLKYKGTDLEQSASAEVTRVKIAFASTSRIINETLTVTEPDGSKKVNNDIKTSMLIKILKTDSSWESRVNAARLLGSRSQVGVPDSLLEACREDNHLEVVRIALNSFKAITGHSHDVLMCDGYEKWWSGNKDKIVEKLKPLDSK